ncbi:MAG TPA: hypothetical protein VF510_24710 [Ktedonobacterales bacterium]
MSIDEEPIRNISTTQRYPKANPDDPPVPRIPRGPEGPRPEPYFAGLLGRRAIVEGQVLVVAFLFIGQLWLVTEALYELLSGRTDTLGWLTLTSFIGFLIALIVWRWPRRRLES